MNREHERRIGRELDDEDRSVQLRARNRLIEASMGQVEWEARSLAGRGVPAEDLCQEAVFALAHAASRWEPERGRFWTFARAGCRGRMLALIEKQGTPIRVPRFVGRLRVVLDRLLEQEPNLSVEDLAERARVTPAQVEACLRAGRVVASIDEHPSIAESLTSPDVDHDQRIDLSISLEGLPDEERRVIELHHLHERSIPEVQVFVRHAHARVREAEARALEALAEGMES